MLVHWFLIAWLAISWYVSLTEKAEKLYAKLFFKVSAVGDVSYCFSGLYMPSFEGNVLKSFNI